MEHLRRGTNCLSHFCPVHSSSDAENVARSAGSYRSPGVGFTGKAHFIARARGIQPIGRGPWVLKCPWDTSDAVLIASHTLAPCAVLRIRFKYGAERDMLNLASGRLAARFTTRTGYRRRVTTPPSLLELRIWSEGSALCARRAVCVKAQALAGLLRAVVFDVTKRKMTTFCSAQVGP
jgi:hypothetical protein